MSEKIGAAPTGHPDDSAARRTHWRGAAAPLNVWQQAIDVELVSAHLGVAHNDATFEGAQKAIHELICWHIAVATDPATNGGQRLTDAKPIVWPVAVPEPVAAQVRFKRENDTTWGRWKDCAVGDAREIEAYTLANGWGYEVRFLYTEQQVQALLTAGEQAQADKEMQLAMQEASSLAQSIFALHYREDEDYASGRVVWGLCDSLRGVISQIDNMTTGLVRSPQPQAEEQEALEDMLDTARTDLEMLRKALGVAVEPHQTLADRMIEAARAKKPQADALDAEQPLLTVRLTSFPESNGKRNWTAQLVRAKPWKGLVGSAGGITIAHGELWNRVAYEAERARFLIGGRDTEPHIRDYGTDVQTPDEWLREQIERAVVAAAKEKP